MTTAILQWLKRLRKTNCNFDYLLFPGEYSFEIENVETYNIPFIICRFWCLFEANSVIKDFLKFSESRSSLSLRQYPFRRSFLVVHQKLKELLARISIAI